MKHLISIPKLRAKKEFYISLFIYCIFLVLFVVGTALYYDLLQPDTSRVMNTSLNMNAPESMDFFVQNPPKPFIEPFMETLNEPVSLRRMISLDVENYSLFESGPKDTKQLKNSEIAAKYTKESLAKGWGVKSGKKQLGFFRDVCVEEFAPKHVEAVSKNIGRELKDCAVLGIVFSKDYVKKPDLYLPLIADLQQFKIDTIIILASVQPDLLNDPNESEWVEKVHKTIRKIHENFVENRIRPIFMNGSLDAELVSMLKCRFFVPAETKAGYGILNLRKLKKKTSK
jgi:hypothetical protein